MMRWSRWMVMGLVTGIAVSSVVAEEPVTSGEIAALRQEVAELRARGQLTAEQVTTHEQRRQAVEQLVRDVLADADTRASLIGETFHAGHDGGRFYIEDADKRFRLNLYGYVQMRHVYNRRQGDEVESDVSGFEFARTRLYFSGHVSDPKITYMLRLTMLKNGNMAADIITVGYQLTDSLQLWAGEALAPFMREELTFPVHYMAVEGSYVKNMLSVVRVQGVGLNWQDEQFLNNSVRLQAMINDGWRSGGAPAATNLFTQRTTFGGNNANRGVDNTFAGGAADLALTGRVDLRLAGDWAQMRDFSSLPGEKLGVFLGGGWHWEVGRTGDAFLNNDFLAWTVDGSIEVDGLSLYGSCVALQTNNDVASGASDYTVQGWVGQLAYNIPVGRRSIEPFVRFEHLDFGGAVTDWGQNTSDTVEILTAGANVYLRGPNARLTVDVLWAMDPIPLAASGLGLLADDMGQDDQIVVRSQFQLMF